MRIVLSWLNEFGDFADPTDDTSVARLASTMTSLGLEVGSVERVGSVVDGVVTARVVRLERHPDAANVQRVFVDRGDRSELHVWCGAFNMEPGDVVPLATLGTTMPDGRTIERRAILGIESEGMLCSAVELGVGSDHAGILVLERDVELGVSYADALGLHPDVVIEADVTRNRPDCWGLLGVARDLAPALGTELRRPASRSVASTAAHDGSVDGAPDRRAPVELVAADRVGRFTSTVLSGIEVGPSPTWMQRRLEAAGMRAINNVVDASNYVMLELNQPNHAYDLDTLGGGGFRVRTAHEGESLTTLDGERRTFTPADLLICDALDVPIGLAGVMGGLDSEVSDATTVVALEVAWFEPLGVAATVATTGLRSEASARFERGVDPYGMPGAVDRFVDLLRETCPAIRVHAGAADVTTAALPARSRTTEVRLAAVNRLLGTDLTADDLPRLLDPIGFQVTGEGDVRAVVLPPWRPDATAEVDVIEEIARHHGYDRIGKTVPRSSTHGGLTPRQQRRRLVREVLIGLGCSEAMPNPFLAPGTLRRAGLPEDAITIINPLVAEESVLRTSLRPGLLQAIVLNESHRRSGVALFEVGHVYPPGEGELPPEHDALAVVLAGREAPAAVAVWRELAEALGVGARLDQQRVPPGLHRTRSASLTAGATIGAVGEVAPDVLAAFGITERVAIVELDLDQILDRQPKPARWVPTSRQPSSDLDLAFVLADDVPAERLDRAIRQGAGSALVALDLFDVYRGDRVPPGTRSLAYRLRLQLADRSLTDRDIAEVRRAVEAATTKLGAELRG